MRAWVFAVVLFTLSGCGNTVTVVGGGGRGASSGSTEGNASTVSGSTAAIGSTGTPCAYLHGTVTLQSWQGDQAGYAAACYSFRFASNSASLTKNDFDVLWEGNAFIVNTATDDKSFIVDLGDVPLKEVPATVDPSQYATGQFGTHDQIDAVLDHTYVVRTLDNQSQLYAAFRVKGLTPGSNVTIEWEKSVDPSKMVIPSQCLQ